ncbi:MAG: heparinase II/III-family protein [Firmicutes bacterium]|nr:heparinase II/III-family protein [Bacillota bacterium]
MSFALLWYRDVYVNWQPRVFPFAVAVLAAGILALTLLVLWARGESKAIHYIWKPLLSMAVGMGVLNGVSFLINNVIGGSGMARQAAAVAIPLYVVQLLALYIFMLKKAPRAIQITLSALLAAGAVYAGVLAWQGGGGMLSYAKYALGGGVPTAEQSVKTRSTVYTAEKRAAMQEQAGSEEALAVIEMADFYAEHIGELRGMVAAEGLPRYYAIGPSGDTQRHRCKYCGTDLHEKFGRYSWKTDPFGHPWKIKCPDCQRWFPSNDFAGYYKLGLDDNGVFHSAMAKEKNDALVAQGEDGYLVNLLYPEKGEGWGVDDGFGYYIAFYIHDGVWDGTGQARKGSVSQALRDLRDAYLYTGEEKYGKAGASLLNRIADVYPNFDWGLWNGFRGLEAKGTILDVVWGNYLASDFCLAYDAFFPVMDEAMRLNIENGILRAVYRFAREGKLKGNFGITQQTVTAAAVVLDTLPETGEWLDYVMAYGGGDVMGKLIDVVDRDGMGDEASPSYNSIWVNYLIDMAELLDGYDTYPAADLYRNPKFVQMLYAQLPVIMGGYYSAQIGDSGQTACRSVYMQQSTAMKALQATGDPVFRQFLDGELDLGSTLMAGYGLAALRNGQKSDFWVYFGQTAGHGHADSLNLGFDAFGLNMAPELGYPVATADDPHDVQWLKSTLSHNTVFVDGKIQPRDRSVPRGFPLHFDDAGRVKVMDIDDSPAYPQVSEYRRTVVMVEVDDDVSYGVDFFRVTGGDDHIYSFHSQSDEIFGTEGLVLVAQKGGSYVGADVPCGPNDTCPPGFSWLDNVRRAKNPGGAFAVDFAVKDFQGVLEDGAGLHLRMTQLNTDLSELAIARGMPPGLLGNPEYLEYVLARRTGKNLDSLFTTVFEPYRNERYIAHIEAVPQGVKLTHTNGRVDVIEYMPDDCFVRVLIYAPDGSLEYSYMNDAQAYTGKVVDFTKELSLGNSITVKLDRAVDLKALAGQHIYIDNDGKQNGVYKIESARGGNDGSMTLDIGRVSLIRGLKDKGDLNKFVYNIKAGQAFRIPMPQVTGDR